MFSSMSFLLQFLTVVFTFLTGASIILAIALMAPAAAKKSYPYVLMTVKIYMSLLLVLTVADIRYDIISNCQKIEWFNMAAYITCVGVLFPLSFLTFIYFLMTDCWTKIESHASEDAFKTRKNLYFPTLGLFPACIIANIVFHDLALHWITNLTMATVAVFVFVVEARFAVLEIRALGPEDLEQGATLLDEKTDAEEEAA